MMDHDDHEPSESHHEAEVDELRADPALAVEYLKAALEALDDPEDCGGALLALRAVAEAHGGVGAIAEQAELSREALYRALSPKGNPTLRTLAAVLKPLGLRLTVVSALDGRPLPDAAAPG